MKKSHILFVVMVCFSLLSYGQITLIGHTKLNNTPLPNTNVIVKDGNAVIKTFNTEKKSEFLIKLEFGKNYTIYFQHAHSPVMFMEVIASNIPQDKYDYRMGYALDVPFCNSNDMDIDTTVFKNAFHKVIYDGKTRMIDDTLYNNKFARNVLKKPEAQIKAEKLANPEPVKEQPTFLAGTVLWNNDTKQPAADNLISVIAKSGKVLKSTFTNKYGAFVFSDIMVSDVAKLKLAVKPAGTSGPLSLVNTKHTTLAKATPAGESCEWALTQEELASLTEHHFTTNIGGKLVSSSAKEKKFFAGKTVYLSNKFNTILQKTKTNLFGTFVFEDIKPDNSYLIGVDKTDIAAGEKIDLLNKEDGYISTLDTLAGGRTSMKLNTTYNKIFNELSIGDGDMKMDIKATIFGDNVNNPIGKLKIILLNDQYEVIDSVLTDNLGTFKFKYLPFLKRFYLSAENTDNVLDVFKNILIYSSDDNLIKIMTHQKGTKFSYKPVNAEMSRLRDIELDDPWLEFVGGKKTSSSDGGYGSVLAKTEPKSIVENILFENGKYEITPASKEILDKIILVLNTNKNLKIEIGAHTDSKGSDVANLKLSQMRAKTVQTYITNAGIEAGRIISKGYGETKPRNTCGDNCSETEYAQNRRIEFKILGE